MSVEFPHRPVTPGDIAGVRALVGNTGIVLFFISAFIFTIVLLILLPHGIGFFLGPVSTGIYFLLIWPKQQARKHGLTLGKISKQSSEVAIRKLGRADYVSASMHGAIALDAKAKTFAFVSLTQQRAAEFAKQGKDLTADDVKIVPWSSVTRWYVRDLTGNASKLSEIELEINDVSNPSVKTHVVKPEGESWRVVFQKLRAGDLETQEHPKLICAVA